MAVKVTAKQDMRENSPSAGKWYLKVVYFDNDTVTTDMLAERIEEATTLTKTDVVACITAFLTFIRQALLDGRRVELDNFGYFKVGVQSKGAVKLDEFPTSAWIKNARVLFGPAVKTAHSNGKQVRVKKLIDGVKFTQYWRSPSVQNAPEAPKPGTNPEG